MLNNQPGRNLTFYQQPSQVWIKHANTAKSALPVSPVSIVSLQSIPGYHSECLKLHVNHKSALSAVFHLHLRCPWGVGLRSTFARVSPAAENDNRCNGKRCSAIPAVASVSVELLRYMYIRINRHLAITRGFLHTSKGFILLKSPGDTNCDFRTIPFSSQTKMFKEIRLFWYLISSAVCKQIHQCFSGFPVCR